MEKTKRLGLSSIEAQKLLKQNGPNLLVKKKELHFILQVLSHFKNPLIIILLIATAVSAAIGELTDATIIACMILFGVILDFAQEYSANKALQKLLATVQTKATVIRDGFRKDIAVSKLVVGDLIILSSGDMVPADAQLVEAEDFFVNQSAITGESFPVEKTVNSDKTTDQQLYSGSNVVSGSAKALITKTGNDTEFGKIAQDLSESDSQSEFEKGATKFGYFLMKTIFVLVVFIFFFNSLFRHDYLQSFMFGLAIAVGITPELLPMIMAITMTVGSKKMYKKGVIVKKLSAIPDFGSMNILCTDKTGTLTENKIRLVQYSNYNGEKDEGVLLYAYLNSYFQTGIVNPLDDAVLSYKHEKIAEFSKVEEIPYDFFRKRLSIAVKRHNSCTLITKGAPEEIIKYCTTIKVKDEVITLNNELKKTLQKTYHDLSSQGFRVLSVSSKSVAEKKEYSISEEKNMTFEGFVSFLDNAKKDVKDVLLEIKNLGIAVKIITGDNELVTQKICQDVGLEIKGILKGEELDKMTEPALKVQVQHNNIFARCSPEQKNRIINALKADGNVVGYMGDGINDAPSLKSADVGISVESAVDVTKESADMVLTKKSLGDLKDGIIEGRKTFANTMKYIMMALSSNFGNMFSAAGAILFLPYLPMLPIQILLNDLIYDSSQIAIPYDNVDPELIKTGRRWDLKAVKKFMYLFGPISSIYDFATFFLFFFVLQSPAHVFQTCWFLESLATQTLIIHIIRTRKIPFIQSRPSKWLVLSSLVCVSIGWIIPFSPLGPLFKFSPLPGKYLLMIAGLVILYLCTVEIAKRLFYKRVNL